MSLLTNNASSPYKDLCRVASDRASELTKCKPVTIRHGLASEDEAGAPIINLFNEAGDTSIFQ